MATTFKVATLIIKTLVKPIAGQLKKNAVNPGMFRDSCQWAGQVQNTVLTHIQLRSMGHKVKKIKPLAEDDAVKAGADLFAEGLVLTCGMMAIGAEVVRKSIADAAAADKKRLQEIDSKHRKELRLLEKERALREQLLSLEERMMDVENAKFHTLHDKLLYEQTKHLFVTENLLKRLHYLEEHFKINTPYPLHPNDLMRIPKPKSCGGTDHHCDTLPVDALNDPHVMEHHGIAMDAARNAIKEISLEEQKISDNSSQPVPFAQMLSNQATSLFHYGASMLGATEQPAKVTVPIVSSSTHNYNPNVPQTTIQHLHNVSLELETKLAALNDHSPSEMAKLQHHAEEDLIHHLFDYNLPTNLAHISHKDLHKEDVNTKVEEKKKEPPITPIDNSEKSLTTLKDVKLAEKLPHRPVPADKAHLAVQ